MKSSSDGASSNHLGQRNDRAGLVVIEMAIRGATAELRGPNLIENVGAALRTAFGERAP
jgi:hypothetical protein